MLNKFIANIFASSALLIITFPASAINLVPGVLKFTSNNPELEQTSGTFQFDKDDSFILEGERVFRVSDINLTTPFGTNYSSDDILLSVHDSDPTFTIPVFSPSRNTLERLVIEFDYDSGNEKPIYFNSLDFDYSFFTYGNTYIEFFYGYDGYYGETYDDGTYIASAIPEPLTILGTGTAIAFGVGFKRKLSKSKKK